MVYCISVGGGGGGHYGKGNSGSEMNDNESWNE